MKDQRGQPITKSSGCTFEEWKRRVDAFVYNLCGIGCDDSPDWGYRDAYDSNVRPSTAAKSAMKAANDF